MDALLANAQLLRFDALQLSLTLLMFVWGGFVRSGLGFGGAALGLPLLLLIHDQALFWLPMIGLHLLFFTSLTLRTRMREVDWGYLRRSGVFILPAALVGVLGLLNLPNHVLLVFIYGVAFVYGSMWVMGWRVRGGKPWLDKTLLAFGGYVAGTSLTGAPLIVAVYMKNVAAAQLRNTLFALWFLLVMMKMATFVALNVDIHFLSALLLLPTAAIGHIIGLRAHEAILQNDRAFKRIIGSVLMTVCLIGLVPVVRGYFA